MTVAVMQPYLFPYIGYFQLVNYADVFVFYDDVNYIKNGYINRNSMWSKIGPQLFTIPVIKSSSYKKINEIYCGRDVRKLLKSFKQNYAKAPFLEQVMPLVEDVLCQDDRRLDRLAAQSVTKTANYLGIETDFLYSSDLDYDRNLNATDKLCAIMNVVGESDYCNSIGGCSLYSAECFYEHNINLSFLSPQIKSYAQNSGDFISGLSIIDVMMWNDIDRVSKLLMSFDLV